MGGEWGHKRQKQPWRKYNLRRLLLTEMPLKELLRSLRLPVLLWLPSLPFLSHGSDLVSSRFSVNNGFQPSTDLLRHKNVHALATGLTPGITPPPPRSPGLWLGRVVGRWGQGLWTNNPASYSRIRSQRRILGLPLCQTPVSSHSQHSWPEATFGDCGLHLWGYRITRARTPQVSEDQGGLHTRTTSGRMRALTNLKHPKF